MVSKEKIETTSEDLSEFAEELEKIAHLPGGGRQEGPLPRRINADPDKMEQGLARLVLTLIELLRRLLEKQALRRIEGGSLTEEEIERLGLALMKLEKKMKELKETFGLHEKDLNLDLGPLGDLM